MKELPSFPMRTRERAFQIRVRNYSDWIWEVRAVVITYGLLVTARDDESRAMNS